MIRLVKAEAKKIFYYRSFMACTILYLVFLPLMFIGIGQLSISKTAISLSIIFNYPDLWHNLSYLASWFNLLLGIMFILLISNEFVYKTLRQNVIDGVSRNQLILSKFIVILIIAFLSTFYILLSGLIIGEIYSTKHSFDDILKESYFLITYFIQSVAYMSLGLLVGMLFRRQGTPILFFLLYTVMIEPIVSLKIPAPFNDYMPMNILGNLVNNPLPGMIGTTLPHLDLTTTVIGSITYIILFVILSLILVKKIDL